MEVEVGGAQGGRIVKPTLNDDKTVTVDMGKGEFLGEKTIIVNNENLDGYQIVVGNPHFVSFVDSKSIAALYAKSVGHLVENHREFQPARTNVEFVYAPNKNEINVYVWERGAGATLACGTGASASQFASHKRGLTEPKATVHLPGGDLLIEVLEDDTIMMTGPAEYIMEGSIPDIDKVVSDYLAYKERSK
jgi:diaminopimelate epimerase